MREDFLTVFRPLSRVITAVLIVLVLAGTGAFIVLQHGKGEDLQNMRENNDRAARYVESLYHEAEGVNRAVHFLKSGECTNEQLRPLRHIVAVSPHIRSVNFYRHGEAGCSSLEGRLDEPDTHIFTPHIPFYTVMRRESEYKFFMVYFDSPSGLTGIAINGYFVREALRYISPRAAFYPLQDYQRLKPPGYAWKSSSFPFVLVSENAQDAVSKLEQNRALMLFILIVSVVTGYLLYVCTGLFNSPRYALTHHMRHHSFYPVYQPVVSMQTGQIAGLEVLMRCRNKHGSEYPPSLFIPLAEQHGMIAALTENLLACVQRDFPLFKGRGLYLAVNVTPDMLENPKMADTLLGFGERARLQNLRVMIEVTERQSFTLTVQSAENVARLRNAGLLMAIDDFGTGFSNLSSIVQLAPDYLKIDKDFSSYAQVGDVRETLLESILNTSLNTGIPVIAEGIETPSQLQYMKDRGVWLFQGYLFSRPMTARSASDFIRKYGSGAGS